MRRIMMIAMLALSFFAASQTTTAHDPLPECDPNCPWVR